CSVRDLHQHPTPPQPPPSPTRRSSDLSSLRLFSARLAEPGIQYFAQPRKGWSYGLRLNLHKVDVLRIPAGWIEKEFVESRSSPEGQTAVECWFGEDLNERAR